jgi:hypothetical protein
MFDGVPEGENTAIVGLAVKAWVVVLLASCGRTGLMVEEHRRLEYRFVAECSEPRWVDGGLAYVGQFTERDSEFDQGLEPFFGNVPSMLFRVDGFYLEQDEASIDCYDRCIAVGACPARTYDPDDNRLPASVTVEGASAFCAFRGGRLPTLAELSRASHPDEIAVGDPELVRQYMECGRLGVNEEGFTDPNCDWLLARNPLVALPVQPVGSEPRDTGPYGHRDLFGAQIEVTSSRGFPLLPAYDHATFPPPADPGSFGTGPIALFSPVSQLRDVRDLGYIALSTYQLMDFPEVQSNVGALYGVRCAFSASSSHAEGG